MSTYADIDAIKTASPELVAGQPLGPRITGWSNVIIELLAKKPSDSNDAQDAYATCLENVAGLLLAKSIDKQLNIKTDALMGGGSRSSRQTRRRRNGGKRNQRR